MKFKIEGVNVEKVFFSTPKITSKLTCNTKLYFFLRQKKSTFTPPILNFNALPFQNSFCFGSSSYQKKVLVILKILFEICLVDWYDFIPMVGFALGLQHGCSLPAACTVLLKFIYRL